MIDARIAGAEEVPRCLRIRWTVFVEEQGVPPSMEVDEHDRAASTVHVLGLWRGVPAGAARLVMPGGGAARIGRVAVVDGARGHGLGSRMVALLEAEARRRGAREIILWSQLRARTFWQARGYAARGAEFLDAGIPHVEMRKEL